MSSIAEHVAGEITAAIDTDRLVLPTLPEIALKVREVAEDADASIQHLGDVISGDTALAARIIKIANSPLYRGARDIEDLNMALSRLGMQTTSTLATGLAMEQMFQATSDMIDKRMRGAWKSASEIAGICHVLCKHLTSLRPDQAALAGLIHQIGVLPILAFAEESETLLRDSMTLDRVIDEIHPRLGVRILEAWDFPTEIRSVPTDYLDFSRSAANADYADLVTVAMLQSYNGMGKIQHIDLQGVTAFERLGLDPEIDAAEAKDLSDEMADAVSMLA